MADSSDICFSDLSSPEREAAKELIGLSRSNASYSAHFTMSPDVHKRPRNATNECSTRCSFTDRKRVNGDAIAQHESDREAVVEPLPGLRRFSMPNITLDPDVRRRLRRTTTKPPTRCSSAERVRVNKDAIAQHESGKTPLVIVTCTTCYMYSLASAVSIDGFTCTKCIEVLRLTEKVAELESRIRTLVEDSKTANVTVVNTVSSEKTNGSVPTSDANVNITNNVSSAHSVPTSDANVNIINTVSSAHSVYHNTHGSVPTSESSRRSNWVTVRRHSHIRRPSKTHNVTVLSNRFDPLRNTLAETPVKSALVIGDSILRNTNIEAPNTLVDCIPGARTSDIRSKLKVLANAKRKFSKIVIHAGTNDTRLRQSEITKDNIKEMCEIAKTMSDNVICSGPLPAYRGDETHSRLVSLNGWMSKWCPQHNVGFIDNWKHFWGRPFLLTRDGLHPTSEGSAILTRNLINILNSDIV
ncbi:uncharacterized protein [Misgurnus anguillicaudatus]|uniref:uncharacterized protein n=1 Tax=Misgurnus anguillicaudatus TaxID=75329 RepID=UPI003CCFCB2C